MERVINDTKRKIEELGRRIEGITNEMSDGLKKAIHTADQIEKAGKWYWDHIHFLGVLSVIYLIPFIPVTYKLLATLLTAVAIYVHDTFYKS